MIVMTVAITIKLLSQQKLALTRIVSYDHYSKLKHNLRS